MLVLTRRRGESIVIDGHILLTVIDVVGPRVRLGIEAPKEMPIHRAEVQNAIDAAAKFAREADVEGQ